MSKVRKSRITGEIFFSFVVVVIVINQSTSMSDRSEHFLVFWIAMMREERVAKQAEIIAY